MTVTATQGFVAYQGTGAIVPYPVPFRFMEAGDLLAIKTTAAGVDQTLMLTTDYTVAGVDSMGGGSLIPTAPIAIGETLSILLNPTIKQPTIYVPNDPFPAKSHERALDRLTLIAQRIKDEAGRGVKAPAGEAALLPVPRLAARAGRVSGFDGAGQPTVGPLLDNLATVIAAVLGGVTIGKISSVVSIGAMIALNKLFLVDGDQIEVLGYYAPGDRGGGLFRWYAGDATATNVGTVFAAAAGGTGRWKRVLRGERFNVRMFGAKGDNVAADRFAINQALTIAGGGIVFVPRGTYACLDGRIEMAVSNTTLLLDENTTLRINAGKWNGTQNPFLNLVHITADNCWLEGTDWTSLIQNVTSDANGVGWLHCGGGGIRNIRLSGDKANVPAITDDTFQSALEVVNVAKDGSYGNQNNTPSNLIIDNVLIDNWAQYGFNIYGNLARGIRGSNFIIEDVGRAGDPFSVGSAIVMSRAPRDIVFTNFILRRAKGKAIFQTSAGDNAYGYAISNFHIESCGAGISFTEELNYASAAGIGTEVVSIGPGTIRACSGPAIKFGTYDNVGFLRNVNLTGVVATYCQYGLLVQTNAGPVNRTSNINITGCSFLNNTVLDLAIGPGNDTILHGANAFGTCSDYQMSFVPFIKGTTSAGVGTYGAQIGVFQRISDNVMWFSLVLDWSAHTGTGDMRVGGLPKISASGLPGGDPGCVIPATVNAISMTGYPNGFVPGGSTEVIMSQQTNGSNVTNAGTIQMDPAGTVRLTGTYNV